MEENKSLKFTTNFLHYERKFRCKENRINICNKFNLERKSPLMWKRQHFLLGTSHRLTHMPTFIQTYTHIFTHQWQPPAHCLRQCCSDLFWSKQTSLHDTSHTFLLTSPPPLSYALFILIYFFKLSVWTA